LTAEPGPRRWPVPLVRALGRATGRDDTRRRNRRRSAQPLSPGVRRCAAELVGTFLLVFSGPGTVIINEVFCVGSLGSGLSFAQALLSSAWTGH
jgi:hypothetical protein